jgi:3-oxoisoapionate decarboxylase
VKIGIDSYCYHRFFGDWYPGLQADPGRRMTIWDFLERARGLGAEGVSLEACYLPATDAFLGRLRDGLDKHGFERVWAWGHPDGLGSGTKPAAAEDLVLHLGVARRLGAGVMRICCGGRRTRPTGFWAEHQAGPVPLLRRLVGAAEANGVVIAIENHLDLLADELVELLETIDSPWLGVCLDTANNLRMAEEPLDVVRKLAPFARAAHVKDVGAQPGAEDAFAAWPSVPLGTGAVDIAAALRLLRQAGYAGVLALEIDYLHPACGEDEEQAIERSFAFLRSTLEGQGG